MELKTGVQQSRYYRFMQIKNEYKVKPLHDIHLRVAMYGRVSTNRIEQKSSIINQEQYYTKYIENNPNWEYVGEYIDEGITGTSTAKRENFQKMIDDALAGKFDMIITKEISRFARNTLDSIYYTRTLLQNNVAVFFQNDNINTLDEDSELRLTIMSGIAQEEVSKLSKRIKFGHKQSIKNGTVFGNSMIYGYTKNNGKLVIDSEEAKMIQYIFEQYASGSSSTKRLENDLYELGYRNHKGGKINSNVIKHIITNPKYKGYYCGNKVEIIDIFSKKQYFKPENEWTQWRDDSGEIVPAIVNEEIWEQANKIYQERSQEIKSRKHSYKTKNLFTGKIYCSEHNVPFWMKQRTVRGNCDPRWTCSHKINNGANSCDTVSIPESILLSIIKDIVNMMSDKIDDVINVYIKYLTDVLKKSNSAVSISSINEKIAKIEVKKEKILEYSLDGILSREEFSKKNQQYNEEIKLLKNELKEFDDSSEKNIISDMNKLRNKLKKYSIISDGDLNNKELIDTLFDKIYVKAIDTDDKQYATKMELNFVLNSGEHIKNILEKKSLNSGGRSENILLTIYPPTEPFCLEVRFPLYPSVRGTPNSLATSYLKRFKAPFASGTAALLEEVLLDIFCSSFGI